MRAVAIDKDVCQLMGINVTAVIGVTFFIGSALAAAAGTMAGAYYGSVWYFMGFLIGLKAFTAAVIGGIGSIGGAMLGGLILACSSLRHADPGHRQRMEGRLLVLGTDPRAGVQADRPPRQVRAGAHVISEEKVVRERVFGPLAVVLSSRRSRWLFGAALLLFLASVPFALGHTRRSS